MVARMGEGKCVGGKLQRGDEHLNGSTEAFLSLCFGLMLPGGYKAALCAKQEENNRDGSTKSHGMGPECQGY